MNELTAVIHEVRQALDGSTSVMAQLSPEHHEALKQCRREPFKWNGIRFLRLDCMTKDEAADMISGVLNGDVIAFRYDD